MKKETKKNIRTIIKNGIPLGVGCCASAIVKEIITAVMPEELKLAEKIAWKIGISGIQLVVTNKVSNEVKKEIDALDPVLDIVLGPEDEEEDDEPAVKPVECTSDIIVPERTLYTDDVKVGPLRTEEEQKVIDDMKADIFKRIKDSRPSGKADAENETEKGEEDAGKGM